MNHPAKLHLHNTHNAQQKRKTRTSGGPPATRQYGRCGNYMLIRVLGKGAFATTYLGQHVYLGTLAAIKVLHAHLSEEETQHFLHEARIVARIKHPHVVPILDFGMEKSVPFLVMEYAPFGTLHQRHPVGSQLPLETVHTYVKQIAGALQHIHNAQFIHCDVKPENLLIGQNERILLADFGVTATVQRGDTQGITRGGTIAYMAPECFFGYAQVASDQYALGVLVYEWLCGERPFIGTQEQIRDQHLYVYPVPLHILAPIIPPAVEAVVMRALEKQPECRFPSVWAFAQALEDAIASTALYAAKPTVIPRRSSRRHTEASAQAVRQIRADQQRSGRHTSVVPTRTNRRTAMTPLKEIAKLFGIDMLMGSGVFVVLVLLGVPINTPWFYVALCMGIFPLIGALMMKSGTAFFCAGSIFIAASVLGMMFQSQIVFTAVYAGLFLLCLLVALAVAYGRPNNQ